VGLDELMVRLEGERRSVCSVLALVLLGLSDILSGAAVGAAKDDSLRHIFSVVKGHGVPVCEAYLDLLNHQEFAVMPFCGPPDGDSRNGFQSLERRHLTASEILALFNRAYEFMHFDNQDHVERIFHLNVEHPERSVWNADVESETGIKELMENGVLNVWTYVAPLDLENNGSSDHVLIWHGYGATDSAAACGELVPRPGTAWDATYVPTRAFILTTDGKRIDEQRTRAVFGASGALVGKRVEGPGKFAKARPFRPLADSVGIFRYQGRYYIDTQNIPKSEGAPTPIVVSLRENGHTKQQCSLLF